MRKFLIYFFLFLLSALSFFASGVIDSQDGFQYLGVARKIFYTGEPTAPSPKDYLTGKNIHLSTEIAANGKAYSPTGLGYSLAMIPAVAITDFFYKAYHVTPTSYFPLQSDWLVLLLASFTNCFFAAILGVVFFLYFMLLGLSKKQSIFMTLISIFATNLFAYSKHSFAHMMFLTFMTMAFLFIKYFSITNKKIFLFLSGLSLGIMMISYNQTYVFTIFPYIIYYLLLTKFRLNFDEIKKRILHPLIILAGIFPFWLWFWWFNYVRYGQHASEVNPASFLVGASSDLLPNLTAGVLLEGLYGLLLGPGRSIFLYSPLLLLPFIFWHKTTKKILPELVSFVSMMVIYVLIFSSSYKVGRSESQGIEALWHGEYSWGPRYMLPMVPLGMIVVAFFFKKLTRRAKLLVFLPLALIGLYVEILGVVMPYQIKFQDLDVGFQLNNIYYRASVYTNLLPRHSPILMMSKKLIKLAINLPKTLNHGHYNVRFYDGIDFPFNVGGLDRWRVIDQEGHISFDNPPEKPIKKIAFNLINHPLDKTASSPAYVNVIINNKKLFEEDQIFPLTERKSFKLALPKRILKSKGNEMTVMVRFDNNAGVVKKHNQFLAMMSMFINEQEVNKESVDVPYLSDFGPSMTGITYKNWGGMNKNPWIGWNIHTQIFERVPDFWWAKAMYYWDFPRKEFLYLFIFNIFLIVFFAYKVYKNTDKVRRKIR